MDKTDNTEDDIFPAVTRRGFLQARLSAGHASLSCNLRQRGAGKKMKRHQGPRMSVLFRLAVPLTVAVSVIFARIFVTA